MYSSWLYSTLTKATGPLIVGDRSTYSAAYVRTQISAYQETLKSIGVGPNSRVAIMPKRDAQWVMILAALLLLEASPTLIDHKLRPSSIVTDEDMIISDDPLIEAPSCRHILLKEIIDNSISKAPAQLYCSRVKDEHATVMTVHTSGTTGLPKKVVYSFQNLEWALSAYYSIYQLERNDRILFSLPFHYCYSVIPSCLVPLTYGKTIVILAEGSSSRQTVDCIAREKVGIVVATPGLYKDIARFDPASINFQSLKICDSGGESVPMGVARLIYQQAHVWVTEGYGLSETTSLTHFLLAESDGSVRLGSVGKALPGVTCKIIDNRGDSTAEGDVGELLIQGLMVGRYEDHDAISSDGWFHTGDYFYVDNDGYYYFVGRIKDTSAISPSVAKLVHSTIPDLVLVDGVSDVAYVMQNDASIEVIYSTYPTRSGEDIERDMMRALPSTLTGSVSFKQVSQIPRNTNGKVSLNGVSR